MKADYTKALFANQLKVLLQHKTIDKITIKELTDLCGMNRQSFYYHFGDIYALMEWLFIKEALPFLQKNKGEQIWEKGIPQLLAYMDENRSLFINGYMAITQVSIFSLIQEDLLAVVFETINDLGYDGLTPEEKERLAQYYVFSFTALLESWLKGTVKQSPEELTGFFTEIIRDHLVGMSVRKGWS